MEISREVIAGEVPILPIEGHIELDGEPGILPEFHEPEERDNLDDLSWGSTEFSFPGGQRPGPGRSAWPNHPSGRQGLGGFVRRLLLFGLLLLGGRSFFLGDGALLGIHDGSSRAPSKGNTILVMWSWDHRRKRKLVKGKARQQKTIQWRSMWMQHPVRRQGNGREDMKAYTQSCIQELKHFHQNIE